MWIPVSLISKVLNGSSKKKKKYQGIKRIHFFFFNPFHSQFLFQSVLVYL